MQRRQEGTSSGYTSTTTVYAGTTTAIATHDEDHFLSLSELDTGRFSPPSSCASTVTLKPEGPDLYSGDDLTRGVAAACFPPYYTTQKLQQDVVTTLSGGDVRLLPLTTATTSAPVRSDPAVLTVTVSDNTTTTVTASRTMIWYSPALCPVSYTPAIQNSQLGRWNVICCQQALPFVVTYPNTTARARETPLSPVSTVLAINGSITGTIKPQTIMASPIFVAYDDVQLSSLQSVANAQAATLTPASSDQSSGLSIQAQAGIGIGVSLGVLFIFLIAASLLWKRRRQKAQTNSNAKTELSEETKKTAELDQKTTEINEAGGQARPPEMDHMNVRAEMDGTWRGWEVSGENR